MTAFLRIKLVEVVLGQRKPLDPYCAVNIKEAVGNPDGSLSLQQQKKTFYPDWDRCFDSHLKPGRRMQIIVYENSQHAADVLVETEALARECREEDADKAVKLAVSGGWSRTPLIINNRVVM